MSGIPSIEPYSLPTETDLPPNTAEWVPDPRRVVLLVHDMQRYFLRPFPLQLRDRLVGNVDTLRQTCAGLGIPVGFTAQPGSMTTEQRGLLKDFWGPGMRVDPADRAIVEPLVITDADWRFTKWRYSAFFQSDLLARMRAHGRDQLIVCGVYAHVGVLMTAIDAFTNDIETFVAADAIADFSAEFHEQAVHYAATRCAVVATTSELTRRLTAVREAHV
ncbi:isochorismatase family protein [Kibdelosporangium phytohabitans]|uniref:Isochorismatase n=1 Tax=Kibdelosporangium phytohabitans TaxID=860235 RepID=A0A0N9HZY4_9PSEU|nr:isochorismatase family protein [Kibdelosporangium phytohabitans]ALG09309.1 isochorismatase [Kibdelosporangium phytohabitans]MBE1469435.1 isochorismate hydrolase [Kibdelosporangium phytohabitans]